MAYTTINKSTDYFNTKLFTGNGGTNAITGVGFQPDWVWLKNRSNADDHSFYDAVRGATKRLKSDTNGAETTQSNGLTAFGTDGFTVGDHGGVNGNGNNIVSWNWKGGTTSGQATNQYSTITPTSISFNQTSGFSIVKYTGNGTAGAGVPHGLNAKPQMIFVKKINGATDWMIFTQPNINTSNATKYLKLNETDAETTSNTVWNGWQPDTTNFSLGTNSYVNNSGDNYIAYVFAKKTGYSKFGSYTGNNSQLGPFIYTGFKPAFVLIKCISGADRWFMSDNKRDPDNIVRATLSPDQNVAEYATGNQS